MKKKMILGGVLSMVAAVCLAGEPIGIANTTNAAGVKVIGASICLLPQRGLVSDIAAWTTISGKVVSAGQVVHNTSGINYYAVNGSGLSTTNQPMHTNGMAMIGVDGILWQVYPETRAKRQGLAITKVSSNGITYVSFGRTAVAGRGVGLTPYGASLVIPSGSVQDPVFVISSDTNDAVCAQDW